MTKETQTVWRNKDGRTMLRALPHGKWTVDISICNSLDDVEELREALTDILATAIADKTKEVA